MAPNTAIFENQTLTIIASLIQHAECLDYYLDDPQFYGHNHSLFHALSLLSLASSFPGLKKSFYWKSRSISRIQALKNELFSVEGISREGSGTYHMATFSSFVYLYDKLKKNKHLSSLNDELAKLIEKSFSSTVKFIRQDQTLPAYGNGKMYLKTMDELQQLYSLLHNKIKIDKKGSGFSCFPDAGYAIYDSCGINDCKVFVDFSPQLHSHHHFDATSFVYWYAGVEWIIDSGGPYRWDAFLEKSYFISSKAHNVCEPDQWFQSNGYTTSNFIETDNKTVLNLVSNVYGARGLLRRKFTFYPNGKTNVLTIFKGNIDRPLVARLHLHPGVVANISNNTVLLLSKNLKLRLNFYTGKITAERGKKGPWREWIGWVSHAAGALEPTTVLTVKYPIGKHSFFSIVPEG